MVSETSNAQFALLQIVPIQLIHYIDNNRLLVVNDDERGFYVAKKGEKKRNLKNQVC